jgi:hypothetical protein
MQTPPQWDNYVEYTNLVDSMHAKRCHRFCDSKIVSIHFLAAG